MLRIALEGITPRLIASCMNGNCQNITPNVANATRKYLSQSQSTHKEFIIQDHYDFDKKVINSDNPVIVNFHAEWCDPCKILTPKLSEMLQNSDEIDLAIIDVEMNTDLVETFEVKAVPAVLAFRNGVVMDKFIGLVDANSIEALIENLKRKQRNATPTTEGTTSSAESKK